MFISRMEVYVYLGSCLVSWIVYLCPELVIGFFWECLGALGYISLPWCACACVCARVCVSVGSEYIFLYSFVNVCLSGAGTLCSRACPYVQYNVSTSWDVFMWVTEYISVSWALAVSWSLLEIYQPDCPYSMFIFDPLLTTLAVTLVY